MDATKLVRTFEEEVNEQRMNPLEMVEILPKLIKETGGSLEEVLALHVDLIEQGLAVQNLPPVVLKVLVCSLHVHLYDKQDDVSLEKYRAALELHKDRFDAILAGLKPDLACELFFKLHLQVIYDND